jgi:hypothetical protein
LARAFLALDVDGDPFEAVLFGAGLFACADFDPPACVFVFFAGALATPAGFLGAPDGGFVSGAVTRAS